LNSFCRRMSLTALWVLTGCVKCLFRPGRLLGARQAELLEGCVEEIAVGQCQQGQRSCLGFVVLLSRAYPSKLPSPPSDPVRFPQDDSETSKAVKFFVLSVARQVVDALIGMRLQYL
jgi:hypothetical protein